MNTFRAPRVVAAQPRALAVIALSALLASLSCGGKKTTTSPLNGDPAPLDNRVLVQHDGDVPPGLSMRLSEGKEGAYQPVRVTQATATRLPDAAAEALLARMPELQGEAGDKQEFALRERSRPAPRTGKTIAESFPPASGQAAVQPPAADTTAPLEVVRSAPEGEVPLAPQLSITFSQPMVAVTAHADAQKTVPVTLTPAAQGTWRWIGTKTLLFDPSGPHPRFAQATEYTVTVPAGTRSAVGGELKNAVSWTFATPAPRVIQSWPQSGPQRRDVAMFAAFDQAVDPAAVLATTSVRAGQQTFKVRALEHDDIAGDRAINDLVAAMKAREQGDRYVVFRAEEPLPANAQVEVTIGPGTPSAEGPLETRSAQSFSFRTYGPLEVEEARCGWGGNCPPLNPWYVRFSNPLDAEAFDPDTITIAPELPGRRIEASGNSLIIRGQSKGQTTYRVTLPVSPEALKDQFGQSLGKTETLSFAVGAADPRFWGPSGLVVLDPMARRRTLDVYSINYNKLKVRLHAVTPADWQAFAQYMSNPWDHQSRTARAAPGKVVVDTTMDIKGATDQMVETAIDLGPALQNGLGHVLVVVEPTPWPHNGRPPQIIAWVQATQIGLEAFVDATDMTAWATRLADGAPMADVKLEIQPGGAAAVTGAQGTARIELPAPTAASQNTPALLVAKKGQDTAFVPENRYWWSSSSGWVKRDPGQSLLWYVFDDRAMYRPGEEVHLKGWIRRMDQGVGGGLEPLGDVATQLTYTVTGPRGNEIGKGTAKVNALGGFHTVFKLPATPNLGGARVTFEVAGKGVVGNRSYSHAFQIQEFRRPEYEVSVTAGQGPHIVGQSADVTVRASYYAGGGLSGAEVSWNVTAAPGAFTPPNRDDYIFGHWEPWWGFHGGRHPGGGGHRSEHLQTRTDATGQHILNIDFLGVKPPRPMQVTASATVMDVNRQAWGAGASMLVHPSALYIGLKSDTYFVNKGEPIEYEVIVVDHDGKAVAQKPVSVRAVRMDWAFEKGEYVTKERDEELCERASAATPFVCSFATKQGGQYRVTARVVDDQGRPNETQVTIWVSGGDRPPAREVEKEEVTLIPDKKDYRAGDTAQILVQAPFYPAEGLLSVRRSGMVKTERFTMKESTVTLTVPIVDGYVPNVHVQVDLVGSAARIDDQGQPAAKLPERPAFASGQLNLSVPPTRRELAVEVDPRAKKLAPGQETDIDVTVRDAAGKPVAGAELAVVVVDESILALTSYQLKDPMAVFYGHRPDGVNDYYLHELVKLARPEMDEFDDGVVAQSAMRMEESAGGISAEPAPPPGASRPERARKRKGESGDSAQGPIMVRKDFNALATFAPEVSTDAQGKAVVRVKVPDNLTRYRVMAVAVSDNIYFGKGESAITARMPLMVRPSAPRFLNFGDTFELPVVVQNQTDAVMDVRVAVRAVNTSFIEGHGRKLSVPANDRVEVRFPAAAEMAGTARFQVAAASGAWTDASEFALPVWTPATTEAFATYGELDSGAVRQPVALPGQVVTQFGGLQVTTSSTQLQALTDAFLYLVAYPFECAEQVSSRVVAVAALRDVLAAFEADGLPPPDELQAAVARDITKLRGMQNHDGGFGFWQRGNPSWPYVSVHVIHAVARAKAKGFEVQQDTLDRGLSYLRGVENHIPAWYPDSVRRSVIAYALRVRKLMGDADPARARTLMDEAGLNELPMDAVGWLLSVMSGDRGSREHVARIHGHLKNRVTETAAAAHFVTGYSDGAHLILHSDRRADGVILEALIEDTPGSDLIPKLVRGLLAHRQRGRWQNTQDNAFVLLALDRYFQEYEKVVPSFVARMWLGDAFAGEQRFRGRSTDFRELDVPMSYIAKHPRSDLIIAKEGKGRLYYRIGMTYAPKDLSLAPADHGFAVERRYEAVDDAGDVSRGKDGVWHIKAGARVRVRVNMVAEARRYHVALVDPLPAGLEAMNPAVAVTGDIPQDPDQQRGAYWWWQRTWYEHQNMRDERVEAFASLLWSGVHEYTYVARATTPGRFIVPPARAEEMYFPETFGRSASDVVVVK